MKQLIKLGFVLLFIIAIANPLLSEEGKNKPPEKAQQTAPKTSSETFPQKPAATAPQVIQNPPQTYTDNLLKEVDCRIDRAIDIISLVATCMGLFLAAIAIILSIAVGLGIFEFKGWKKFRKDANEILDSVKKDAKTIAEFKENMEKLLDEQREKIKDEPLTEKPSKELKDQMDEFNKRLELVELFGFPLKSDDIIKRGNHFYYDGKFEQALKSYEKAIEMDPKNAVAWANKSSTLNNLGRYKDALSTAEKAIGINLDYAIAWVNKTRALGELGRYKDALSAAEKAIEIDPENAMSWMNKSKALGELERHEDSLLAAEKAIEIDPENAMSWAHMSSTLIVLGRYEDAISAAEKAIEIDPKNATALYNRASAYSLKHDKEKALKDLKKAIELNDFFKKIAKEDEDFKSLWDDPEFKKLTE